jgi:hypothetical protein
MSSVASHTKFLQNGPERIEPRKKPELKWVECGSDFTGRDGGPYPTEPGCYRVLISGDSETDGAHVFYEFPDYETWADISFDPDEGTPIFNASHDEEWETMIAWCGPFEIPKRG